MNSLKMLLAVLTVVYIVLPVASAQQPAPTKRVRGGAKIQNPPLATKEPFTLSDVLDMLNARRDNAQIDIEGLVEKQHVSFKCSPELEKVLRDLGASEKLLQVLPKLPAPPPTPPPATAGELSIICKPVDCDVVVNQRYYGKTQGGTRRIRGLQPGDALVEVFSDGYESEPQHVKLAENKPAEQSMVLRPTAGQRRSQAQNVLIEAVNALQSFAGIEAIQSLSVSGSVSLKGDGLKSGPWEISVIPTPAGRLFSLHGGAGSVCSALLSSDIKPQCKGKKTTLTAETLAAAGLLRDASLGTILSNFTQGELGVKQPEGGWELENRGLTDTFTLKLDDKYLPMGATRQTNGTSALLEEIQFADYTEFKTLHYPRGISVVRNIPNSVTAKFTINLSDSTPPVGRR